MIVLTYRDLHKINFPIYILPNDNVEKMDGIVFLDGQVLDDRNQKGETLGIRRIQSPYKELHPLRKSIAGFSGIVKQMGNKTYIDSKGLVFTYEKSLLCKLKYHKVTKIERKDIASTVHLKGIQTPFQVIRPPYSDIEYAGVLYFHGLPWKLYEFSTTKLKDTKKKI